MIPRFDGDGIEEELTEFETMIFREGMNARKDDRDMNTNPFTKGTGSYKVWDQGWCDQDMTELHKVEHHE